jgi:hypothetical protein
VELLAKNVFYYNPLTRHLFTISEYCFGYYVEGLGYGAHFGAVPRLTKKEAEQQAKEVTARAKAEEAKAKAEAEEAEAPEVPEEAEEVA